jgi:hypothetical protein
MNRALPQCRRLADLEAFDGARVRVLGEYVELDLRKNPEPPPQFAGSAGVRLEDGAVVLLEPSWSPRGLRSRDESARLAGRRVEATGRLWKNPPAPSEPVAQVLAPCLSPVESVDLAGPG